MHSIEIGLLGGLRIRQGDQVITRFSTQKTAALLACLAWNRGKPQPREHLIEMLWPSSAPQAGRASLSMALSSLRHQLEPPGIPSATVLMADRFAVKLNAEVIQTDVARFESAVEAARRAADVERTARLREAVEAYAGPLLPGFYEDWITPAQQRLASLYFQAAHQLIRHEVRAGDTQRALEYARRLVEMEPLREEAHHDLIRLLAARGEPGAALQQYREMAALLERELGSEPSAASRQLARDIEQLGVAPLEGIGESPRAAPRPALIEPPLPVGTVTFVALEAPTGNDALMAIREETVRHGGAAVRASGPAWVSAFSRATSALAFCVAVRTRMDRVLETLPREPDIRIALNTGEVDADAGTAYGGPARDRALDLLAAASSGQVLVSDICASLLRHRIEPGTWSLTDLGVYRLRGAAECEHLYQVVYAGMPRQTFPPPRAEAAFSPQLPSPATRFIGRVRDLARLQALLAPDAEGAAPCRLITILGPGGTGKTRLSIEAARRTAGHFGGAVWFVPLAELPENADLRQVAERISDALGAAEAARDPFEQIADALRRRKSLIVLDNLEQIVDVCAAVVRRLMVENPDLFLIVTSRHKLELTQEVELALSPLPAPHLAAPRDSESRKPITDSAVAALAQNESVQLFIDRAQGVKPDFQLTSGNAEAVARLCERLEGIPLALELAAARAQVLTPGQMLVQLSKQASRFDLLVSRKRDLAERHRTLRGAIEWSYRLLASDLRTFMARLSVFRGGWSLAAAEVVLDEPLALDYLAQLRECSLIVAQEVESWSSPEIEIRFRMLETLREFAADILAQSADADRILQAHLAYYLRLAEEAEPNLRGPDQVSWMNRLAVEHENFQAALRFALQLEEGDAALRLVAALWRFWAVRGHFGDGRAWCEQVLDRTSDRSGEPHRVRALNGAGLLAMHQSDYPRARSCFDLALTESREAGDRGGEAESLRNLGILASDQKRFEEARTLHEQALGIWRALGDRQGTASALSNLGLVSIHLNEMDKARELLSESLEITRAAGNRASAANTLNTLGMLAYRQQDHSAAAAAFRESLEMEREVANPRGIATALLNLGSIEAEAGSLSSAREHLSEAVDLILQLGDRRILAHALNGLGVLAGRMGLFAAAARTFGAVEALCESVQLQPLSSRESEDAEVNVVRAALGPSAFDTQWQLGRSSPLTETIEAVRRETGAAA